jgi:predicted dehydrogenase
MGIKIGEIEMTQELCTVAIVGAGNMAREHICAFADVPGVKISGIHSRTRSRAEALASEFGIPGVYDSVAELYEKTRADLVVVTVFETAMNPVSKECFDFPWTVLLEKPPGYNLQDAEAIHNAARAKDRKVLVGLNRRFLSSTSAALCDLGKNDSLRFIHVQDQQCIDVARSLGHPVIVVENWMYANSIHVIDYLRTFGRGKIVSVSPIFPWEPKNSQVVAAKVEFSSGDLGLYEGIWKGPGPWAVSVTTPQKRWEMRPLEQAAYQSWGERRLQSVEVHPWDGNFKPGFRLQAEMAVLAALGKPSDSPTLDEAMETMRLIKGIFRS